MTVKKFYSQCQEDESPGEVSLFNIYISLSFSCGSETNLLKDGNIPDMPNPDRNLIPEGYDLYDVYLATWFDDVSGNRSKQYNKHFVGYAANTNLPGQLLQQEFFVEYLSNSQNATALEQLSAIKELVK
jgi:hypothetical protein